MIGKRLSQIISESALKKQDAAKLIGVSPGTISNWIKNEDFQNNSNFFKLCKLAGWNPDWILTGEGDKLVKNEPSHKDPYENYQHKSSLELETEIKVLKEMLKEKEETIRELLDLSGKKETKRGAG